MTAAGIQTVIVPLDGSATAEAAIVPAIQLANRCGAELVFLATRWELTSLDTVTRYLDTRIEFLERDARPLVIVEGEAPAAILHAAQDPGALVCMATHGRSGVAQTVLGSVAEAVVRGCTNPVLLVGPRVRADWTLADIPTVVAGFDGSDPARTGVYAAGHLAESIGGRVRVVEVTRPPDVIAVPRFGLAHVDALESLVGQLRDAGVVAEYEVLEGIDAADTLIEDALRTAAALIALGTHGRSGIGRVVLGSVTTRVVRYSPVPVLVTGPRWSGAGSDTPG